MLFYFFKKNRKEWVVAATPLGKTTLIRAILKKTALIGTFF
jgi:hypothetical protein